MQERKEKKAAGRGHIKERGDISERSSVVDKRKQCGHWEGDLKGREFDKILVAKALHVFAGHFRFWANDLRIRSNFWQ